MSLLDAVERFASLDRSQVVLDEKRCMHGQDSLSTCALCFDICPVTAIQAGKPPGLDTETCTSCLACLPACPTGAFQSDDNVLDLLNCAARLDGKSIELLCGHHPEPVFGVNARNTGVQIQGCLAGLGTGAYLELAALGLETIISRVDACKACTWQKLTRQVRQQAAEAQALLAGWKRHADVHCLDAIEKPVERLHWNAKNPPLSRRDLFRMASQQGQLAMARAMEKDPASGGIHLGRDRKRVEQALTHLPKPDGRSDTSLEGYGFATLQVSEACTACQSCARACPTGAIGFKKTQADEQDQRFELSFKAVRCTVCEACTHVCIQEAIRIDHAPVLSEILTTQEVILASGSLVRCQRCNTFMAAQQGKTLCPTCELRREHPFVSHMPPPLEKAKIQ